MTEPNPPASEPTPPSYAPGAANPYPPDPNPWARPADGVPEYPPTSVYPSAPPETGYPAYPPPPGPPAPPGPTWGYQPGDPAPGGKPKQSSLKPVIAVIVAAIVLLCVGTAVAGTMLVNRGVDAARSQLPELPGGGAAPAETERPTPDLTGKPGPTPSEDPFDLDELLPSGLPGLPDLDDLLPTGEAVTVGRDSTVVYEVTGGDRASITYSEGGGAAPKSERNAKLPWRKEFTVGDTPLLSVTGIHLGLQSTEVTCSITVDGKEVLKKSDTGNAATASCMQLIVVS